MDLERNLQKLKIGMRTDLWIFSEDSDIRFHSVSIVRKFCSANDKICQGFIFTSEYTGRQG